VTDNRPLPLPDPETAFFWEATARGVLEILRCQKCGTWIHYPKPACWNCSSSDLKPEPVSGRGTVYSYTVTHQDVPGYTAPFAVAIIELEEQKGLRMVSNVIDVPADDVRIGMPVEVTFEKVADDVTLPMFKTR
jgi:uncharacterized OB-fold protein